LAAGVLVHLTITLAGVIFPINRTKRPGRNAAKAGFAVSLPSIPLGPTMSASE
jgi:hypothetical protein